MFLMYWTWAKSASSTEMSEDNGIIDKIKTYMLVVTLGGISQTANKFFEFN